MRYQPALRHSCGSLAHALSLSEIGGVFPHSV